jgi:hypothetical protein
MRKSKRLQIGILLIFFLGNSVCRSQGTESQKTVDAIKGDVINFLINQNDLQKGIEFKEYDKRIQISELLEEKTLGYNKTGIYRIRIFTSHTKQYLLIKNDFGHQILDTDNFTKTLHYVLNFIDEQKLPNDKALAYIESVIEIYRINESRNPAKLKEG